jgi:hypothetical protein
LFWSQDYVFIEFFDLRENNIMNDFNVSITTTTRRRRLTGGKVALYPQYYCEYRDPLTRKRRRRAFNRKKDAETFRNALLLKVAEGSYVDERKAPDMAKAIEHGLGTKEGGVKPSTLKGYMVVANGAIRGRCSSAPSRRELITPKRALRRRILASSSCSATSS